MLSAFGNILGRPLSWFTGGGQSSMSGANAEPDQDVPDTDVSSHVAEASNVAEASSDVAVSDDDDEEPYEPTVLDVLVVKAMLNKALALPPELLDTIIDLAEYWPHSTTEWAGDRRSVFGGQARAGHEDIFLLRSIPLGFTQPPGREPNYMTAPPFPRVLHRRHSLETFQQAINPPSPLLEHPCRKIVFTIRSHDQGWGGDARHHGTYKGSWTWFDAGLERFDAGSETDGEERPGPPRLPVASLRTIFPRVVPVGGTSPPAAYAFQHDLAADQAHKIQANVLARRNFTEHRVQWSWTDDIDPDQLVRAGRGAATGNGEFVRGLTLGDVVTVWGRARFPAWVNSVDRVRIDVYWAV